MTMAAQVAGGDLLLLQGQIKRDPEGYREEFLLQYRHYRACLGIFSLKPNADSKEFGDLVMFLSHVAPCFPADLPQFPQELMGLLDEHVDNLHSSLRRVLVQALILLRNRQVVGPAELLPFLFRLFRCSDKGLRRLLFAHIVHDIRRLNQKHRDDRVNRPLQNFLYTMLQDENEAAAKKSLAVLIELYRRKVWTDAKTVNVISTACFHPSPRIMVGALKFFMGSEEVEDESDGDDDDGGKGGASGAVVVDRESIYKGFAEKLFSRLRDSNDRFEVKVMMMNPHQRDVTHLLATAVQACHDQVPPDAVEPLMKQLVNHFVHDRARPELMTEALLRDLALYKKAREKPVASAARSIIALFREMAPSLLEKRDRGRGADLSARPKAFGETHVAEGVPGAELLQELSDDDEDSESGSEGKEEEEEEEDEEGEEEVMALGEGEGTEGREGGEGDGLDSDDDEGVDEEGEDEEADSSDSEMAEISEGESADEGEDEEDDEGGEKEKEGRGARTGGLPGDGDGTEEAGTSAGAGGGAEEGGPTGELSLRALRKMEAASHPQEAPPGDADGFLSTEDFQHIRRMQATAALEKAASSSPLPRLPASPFFADTCHGPDVDFPWTCR
eukprot:jgi/Mesen1/594/ME001074S10755